MSNFNSLAPLALVGLAALLTSCSVKEECPSSQNSKVTVNLQTFDISQSAISKATAKVPPHRIVFKAFDTNGAVAYETVQRSTVPGFGTLNFELAPGTYNFVAVAHDVADTSDTSCAATISSASVASLPDTLVEETFCATKSVTVKPSSAFSTSMTLPRVVSCFRLVMNGTFPSEVKTLKIIANTDGTSTRDLPSFNTSTGLALAERQWIKTADASKSAGKEDVAIKIYLFLTAEQQQIDITATAYDSEGEVVVSRTFNNVPMQQNQKTVASGDFFNGSGSGSFSFNTDWKTDSEINY